MIHIPFLVAHFSARSPNKATQSFFLCELLDTYFNVVFFPGTERLRDRGHSGGAGVLRLPDNQGLPGLSPGETEAVVGTDHV